MTNRIETQSDSRLRSWLARWTRLDDFSRALVDEPSDGVSAWLRTTAGIVVMLLAVQIVTGALLTFYYAPSAVTAHASVAFIEKALPGGSWLRALHHYGSQWLTLFLGLHLTQMFWFARYRRVPVAWLSSILLLGLVLAGGAAGYSLPWDARAFFSTRVGEGIAGGLPLVGNGLRRWILGGAEVSTLTLSRLFALHVLVVPALILLVVAARLFVFREPAHTDDVNQSKRTWASAQFVRNVIAASVVFAALALFTAKYRASLGPTADEAMPGYLPRPGAQFLWLFQMLKMLPGAMASLFAVLVPGLMLGALAALPFIDRRKGDDSGVATKRKLGVSVFAVGLLFIATMTALAYIADRRNPRVRAQLAKQVAEESAFRTAPYEPLRIRTGDAAEAVAANAGTTKTLTRSPDEAPPMYIKFCANCHGKAGQGVKPFPKLLDVAAKPKRTVDDLAKLLSDPVSYGLEPPMKSFSSKLNEAEMREIAEWVATLKKAK